MQEPKPRKEAAASSAQQSCGLDQLISRYEVIVFSLAMHLTSEEHAAEKVVEEVFVRLSREVPSGSGKTIEKLIHRYTYDAALARLVSSAGKEKGEAKEGDSEALSSG